MMTLDRERAALIGLSVPGLPRIDDNLDELGELADTAGADVVLRVMQSRASVDPAFFIGRGKADELAWLAREKDIQLFVFDAELSPVQVRNLENLIQRKIIDRSGIILDIFASRARTREARTQVELAQLQYMMPRLTRQWTHLSKQYGGIGTRGPGETQIETDRRVLRTKISHLRGKLRRIGKEREVQRKGREQFQRVALVGYTNAGKSTLMNRLAGTSVRVEDRLFATLDSTVRAVQLSQTQRILLSDTVGFIRDLPHHLVASFESTLSEVLDADILLHVIDATHPAFEEHIDVVNQTLKEIGVGETSTVLVFNKTERIGNRETLRALSRRFPDSVLISARRGINLNTLQIRLASMLDKNIIEQTITVGHAEHQLIARIHEVGEILEKQYTDEGITVRFRIDRKQAGKMKKMMQGVGQQVLPTSVTDS